MKRYIYLTTLCLLGFYASYATNYTWNGSVSNNWATANNWTPAGVPSSGDSVTIDAASYTPVLDMNRSIQLLTVNSGGELDLNGQTLSVSLVSNLIEARLFNGHLESNDFAAESSIFNVSIDVSAGFLQINSNRFNYPVHIIYIGFATSENGGNSFLSTVDILSNSIGDVLFGHENSDIFEDSLKVKVQNAGSVVLAYSSEGSIFNGYCFFERLNDSSGDAITIGRLENSAYFNNVIEIASNSSSASITSVSLGLTHCFLDTACIVQVHSNGFNQGLFRISNSIISSAIGITLSNEAGFMAEKESTFRESIQVSAPHIYLHNAHFRGESSFIKTGGGIDFSQGPITANRDIIFTNTGGGDFWINGSKGDMFHANVTLNNTTKGGALMFSAAARESFVEGDVMINSTRGKIALATSSPNSLSILGKVYINADSGSVFIEQTTIEQDGSIEIQSIKGNIHFAGLQYNAVAPFNVNLINGNGFLAMKYCNFQPKVNLTLPSVAIAESVFNDSLTITSGVNGLSSWGGLICHGPVVLNRGHNTGAWNLYGNGHPNTFFKNVEINVNDTSSAPFNFNGQHQFYENLSVHASQPLQAIQSHWSFKGANNQQVNLECDSTIQLEKLTVEKSNGLLTLNNDIAVLGELSLNKGIVRVAASANLQLLSSAMVGGGSDSSYVEGFMSKQGAAAFTFPLGGNGSYAPLGIDAVASTCTFKAQYIDEDPDSLYPRNQKEATLGFINRCGYWNLDRTAGTQNTKVTLGWSNNPCFAPNPADAKVARWGTNSWQNNGNSLFSGNALVGSVKSLNDATTFPLNFNLSANCTFNASLSPSNDSLYTNYLFWYTALPAEQLSYFFAVNSVLAQTGIDNSFERLNFQSGQNVSAIVTSLDYCTDTVTAVVPSAFNAPAYQLSNELFLDWSTSAGNQSLFINQKHALKSDNLKNVYVTGSTVNSSGDYDILVAKYDSLGNEIWLNQFAGNGNGNDIGTDLYIDNQYNVYVTGTIVETLADSNDIVVLKYENDGDLAWSQVFDGPNSGNDGAIAISEIDGAIYVSGMVTNAVWPLTDFALLKLNTSGAILWSKVYDNGLFDICTGHRSSGNNEITIEGGTQIGLSTFKYMAVKYDTLGTLVDTTLSGTLTNQFRKLNAVKRDTFDNIYLTGSTNGSSGIDMLTVALNNQLDILWSHTFNSSGNLRDEANDLAYDTSGNVYVAGYSQTAANGTDYRIIKYSSTGTLLWNNTFDGESHAADTARAIHIGKDQLVSITGSSFNGNNDDFYTIQYDANGVKKHEKSWNSWDNGNDRPSAISIDEANAVLVYGQSEDSQGALKYSTLRYLKKSLAILPSSSINNTSSAFLENREQLRMNDSTSSSSISFYSTHSYPEIYFYSDTVSYVFRRSGFNNVGSPIDSVQRIDLWFETDRPAEPFLASNEMEGFTNFYYPHISPGRERVPEHKTLLRKEVWKSIDVQYGDVPAPGFTAIVHKTARANDIRLKFEGASQLNISAQGDLVIEGEFEYIELEQASVYQIYPGNQKVYLPWKPKYSINSNRITLTDWGPYNNAIPLMVEFIPKQRGGPCESPFPPTEGNLFWSTFYGGSNAEITTDVCAASDNSSFLCGRTKSFSDFPVDAGFQTNPGLGLFDAFAVGFSPTAARNWATFYGGDGYDSFNAMAINDGVSEDKLFIVGTSNSSAIIIVAPSGAYNKATNAGGYDGVICRLDHIGGALNWSTYIGGEGFDDGRAITSDPLGNFYLALNTKSFNAENNNCQAPISNSLPLCPLSGSYSVSTNTGGQDIFIVKFKSTNEVTWSTFFGSASDDVVMDMHYATFGFTGLPESAPGDLYITGNTGRTSSTYTTNGSAPTNGDFPLVDASPSSNINYFEASTKGFIAQFDQGGALDWSTNINTLPQSISSSRKAVYIAGLGANGISACSFSNGQSNISGYTPICSTEGGSSQLEGDGYIAKFDRNDQLIWSTCFEGRFEYCEENSLYSYNEDNFPVENGYYIAPAFVDICPNELPFINQSEKRLDISCSASGALYLIGTNYLRDIRTQSAPGMYFDQKFYLGNPPNIGSDNSAYYYTEAFILGYSYLNYQFYGSYFGQEANEDLNFTISQTANNTDFGRAISLSPSDALFIGGHSFAPNQCFPFKEAPPAIPEPYFQSFSQEEEFNAFIARFDIVVEDLPLSNEELYIDNQQNRVYPNPTTGMITLSFFKTMKGNITVTNLMGQSLFNGFVNGESMSLDLNDFSSGIYFVNLIEESNGFVHSFKVVKQ